MDASTILDTANCYMENFLEASKNNAASYGTLGKESTLTLIQNFKSSATAVYSFAHNLIYKSNEDEDETMPLLNELEALYCDTYKPAFDKLLREVKAK